MKESKKWTSARFSSINLNWIKFGSFVFRCFLFSSLFTQSMWSSLEKLGSWKLCMPECVRAKPHTSPGQVHLLLKCKLQNTVKLTDLCMYWSNLRIQITALAQHTLWFPFSQDTFTYEGRAGFQIWSAPSVDEVTKLKMESLMCSYLKDLSIHLMKDHWLSPRGSTGSLWVRSARDLGSTFLGCL